LNISALSEQLVAWFKNQGTELLQPGKGQADPRLAQFRSGQEYVGKVLENLPNARSLVQVGQTRFDMALPASVRAGDSVRLVFVTSGPRPTFQVAQPPVQALAPVRLSDTAQQVNALLRFAQTPAAPGPLPGAAGSVATPGAAPGANPAGAGLTAAPTAAQTPAASTTQAAALASAQAAGGGGAAKPIVQNVAVFFANAGSAPTTSAMTGGSANPALAMAGQAIDAARAALASRPSMMAQGIVTENMTNASLLPMRLRQVLGESGMFYESHLGRWTQGRLPLEAVLREPQARLAELPGRLLNLPGLDGMPEEAARIAGRQLQMLDGGAFFWQGYAWPQQWMEWLVGEDPSGTGDADGMSQWQTELRLTLPHLGEVSARLGVGALGIRVQLATGEEASLEQLRAALPALVERFQAAGLNLTRMELGRATDADTAQAGPQRAAGAEGGRPAGEGADGQS